MAPGQLLYDIAYAVIQRILHHDAQNVTNAVERYQSFATRDIRRNEAKDVAGDFMPADRDKGKVALHNKGRDNINLVEMTETNKDLADMLSVASDTLNAQSFFQLGKRYRLAFDEYFPDQASFPATRQHSIPPDIVNIIIWLLRLDRKKPLFYSGNAQQLRQRRLPLGQTVKRVVPQQFHSLGRTRIVTNIV